MDGPTRERMNRALSQVRRRQETRRDLINEIHFTYANLARLMRGIAQREMSGRLGSLLSEQLGHDQRAQQAVVDLGMELGSPPAPCVCAKSEAILELVHHADRVDRSAAQRAAGLVESLREARIFIIRLWSALLDGVGTEQGHSPTFQRILRLQANEADRHRELVRMASSLGDEHGGTRLKHSA